MNIDRRVQKTKKLLSEALIELILEKGYHNVTVQDILDRANVGRSTFYTHYENKELLLMDGPKNLGHSFFSNDLNHKTIVDGHHLDFQPLFQHISENLSLAKAMIGENSGDIILNSLKMQMAMAIKGYYKNKFDNRKKEKLKLAYLSTAAASALVSLIVSWVDDNIEVSVDEISSQAHKMIGGIFEI